MTNTITNYRTVTAYLCVPDADAEMNFLKTAFGATEVECRRKADDTIMHAELQIGDSLVMLGQSNNRCPTKSAAFYLWVGDVDSVYARALAAGATSESVPEDKPYGHRNAGVIDRNGLTWWIASPILD
jgi:PhnB protein